jgi:hypothetical protein
MHIGAIRDYAKSLSNLPNSQVEFLVPDFFGCDMCDILHSYDYEWLIVHFSIVISTDVHADFLNKLAGYSGKKAIFLQDEYDFVEKTRSWLDKVSFDVVFTIIPKSELEKIYPKARYPTTKFLGVLTGYVPEWAEKKTSWKPHSDRKIDVGYRGKILPWRYGRLGFEKHNIGIVFQKKALGLLKTDISSIDTDRIYGAAWPKFLENCRACLGSESGCNLFDWDGSLQAIDQKFYLEHPDAIFEEYEKKVIGNLEDGMRVNQISPRIFEAIGTKTALVLFKGNYSEVIEPYKHFWPLEKDFSNWEETVNFLKNHNAVEEMAEKAYQDIIITNKYSYKTFLESIYNHLSSSQENVFHKKIIEKSSFFSFHRLSEPFVWADLSADLAYSYSMPSRRAITRLLPQGRRKIFLPKLQFLRFIATSISFLELKVLRHAYPTMPRVFNALPIPAHWRQTLQHFIDLNRIFPLKT